MNVLVPTDRTRYTQISYIDACTYPYTVPSLVALGLSLLTGGVTTVMVWLQTSLPVTSTASPGTHTKKTTGGSHQRDSEYYREESPFIGNASQQKKGK
jgi:hypothetical protein